MLCCGAAVLFVGRVEDKIQWRSQAQKQDTLGLHLGQGSNVVEAILDQSALVESMTNSATVHIDNQGAMALVQNPVNQERCT